LIEIESTQIISIYSGDFNSDLSLSSIMIMGIPIIIDTEIGFGGVNDPISFRSAYYINIAIGSVISEEIILSGIIGFGMSLDNGLIGGIRVHLGDRSRASLLFDIVLTPSSMGNIYISTGMCWKKVIIALFLSFTSAGVYFGYSFG
jgi:hypothetical protein